MFPLPQQTTCFNPNHNLSLKINQVKKLIYFSEVIYNGFGERRQEGIAKQHILLFIGGRERSSSF